MVRLVDHYSEFRRAIHTCKCGWSGTGAMMRNGTYGSLGLHGTVLPAENDRR